MKTLARTAIIILLMDQLSKWLVVQRMGLRDIGEIDVWPPYLTFRMAWNRGVNFGLFGGGGDATRWILIALATAIVVWVTIWVARAKLGRLAQISAGLLVGGALGNVIDRLTYGAVADFLNMSCCGIENPYAFNIADISVFAGALGLALFAGGDKSA
ncbi:MAG TPA: signal peptidase II [Rhodobacterales bacterium]|nr:signal peptidase II [Rhodobacterales bacterium]